MNRGTWTFYILFCTAVLGLAFLAGFLSEYERLPEQGDPLGGSQGIQQLDQWKSDGTNITQQTANKPLKLTGLTPGGCLELTAGNVATTTGSPCLASASGGLATTSIDTESDLESILTDVTNVFTNNDGALSDDDLTNNSIEDLSDVSAITETYGDLLYWNGASWADIATSSLSINFTDLVGSATDAQVTDALTISSSGSVADGALSANVSLLGQTIGSTELASADFGDWTCNGTTCALDTDTVADSEIDYSAVTLADFTNDTDFVTWASATSSLWRSAGLLSSASSTIGSGAQTGGLTISGGSTTTADAYFASKIGIGSTTPSRSLSIEYSSASQTGIIVRNTNTSATASGFLATAATSSTGLEFGFNNSTYEAYAWTALSAPFKIGTNNAERFRISPSGTIRFNTYTTNALLLTSGSDGTVSQASSQTCTNQFVRAMSAAYVATCATVDISSDTNLTAGRSLTLTNDDIAADAELYTNSRTFNYASSTYATSTVPVLTWKVPQAATISEVSCWAQEGDAATSTIQFEERTSPFSAGTDVLYANGITAGSQAITSSSTVSNSSLAAGSYLAMLVEGYLVGTPNNPVCDVKYTYDD